MSQIVISSTDDPTAWDDDNSVTINTIWNLFSANTWAYVSGNASLVGGNGGTWLGAGFGDSVISFLNRSGNPAFGLALSSGTYSLGNAFSSLQVNTEGMVVGGPSDGDSWVLTAR